MIELILAKPEDAEEVLELQKMTFKPFLDYYQDFETSPAMESLEKIRRKLSQEETSFYYIQNEDITLGMIRVVDFCDSRPKRVAPVFVLPQFQNKGIAQKAFELVENKHGKDNWQLSTIKEEKGNCHLYEKLGYEQDGAEYKINDKMTIVYYCK